MAPWLTLPPLPLPPIPPLAVPREVRRMVRLTYVTALTTLVGYGIFLFFGYLRDLFRRLLDWRKSDDLKGYAPICPAFEDFYTRRIYHRIQEKIQKRTRRRLRRKGMELRKCACWHLEIALICLHYLTRRVGSSSCANQIGSQNAELMTSKPKSKFLSFLLSPMRFELFSLQCEFW